MGKRSHGQFERRKADAYQTPFRPVTFVAPFLRNVRTFAEPCFGEGRMVEHLGRFGKVCTYSGDIQTGQDALTSPGLAAVKFDAIITNPPWTREIMHPMIDRFSSIAPTWLLFDADWAHTVEAVPFMDRCSHIISVGRVKWIDDSEHSGKDNAAWYRFHDQHFGGPRFIPRPALTDRFGIPLASLEIMKQHESASAAPAPMKEAA